MQRLGRGEFVGVEPLRLPGRAPCATTGNAAGTHWLRSMWISASRASERTISPTLSIGPTTAAASGRSKCPTYTLSRRSTVRWSARSRPMLHCSVSRSDRCRVLPREPAAGTSNGDWTSTAMSARLRPDAWPAASSSASGKPSSRRAIAESRAAETGSCVDGNRPVVEPLQQELHGGGCQDRSDIRVVVRALEWLDPDQQFAGQVEWHPAGQHDLHARALVEKAGQHRRQRLR